MVLFTWVTSTIVSMSALIPPATYTWSPDDSPPGPLTRVVAGRFHGGLDSDAYALKGGSLIQMIAPALFDHHTAIGIAATDIARFRGAAPSGNDALLFITADGNGVHILYHTGDNGEVTQEKWGTTDWGGVTRITTGDSNGDGVDDTVVGTDGVYVVAEWPSGSSRFSVSGSQVYDLTLFRHDGPTGIAVAISVDDHLEMRDLFGNLIRLIPAYFKGGLLATIRDDRQASERVAWFTPLGPIDQALAVLSHDGKDDDPVQFLQNLNIVGVSSGDMDGDGDDDLAMSSENYPNALVVINDRSDVDPTITSFPITDPTLLVFSALAEPTLTGNTDAPVLLEGTGPAMSRLLHITFDSSGLPASVVHPVPPFESSSGLSSSSAVTLFFGAGALAGFAFPIYIDTINGSGFDHIEVAVYPQANSTSPPNFTPVDRFVFPISPSGMMDIPIPVTWQGTDDVFNFVFRVIEQDANGAVVAAWPPWIVAATTSLEQAALLEQQPGSIALGIGSGTTSAGGASERPIITPATTGGQSGGTPAGGGT